MSFGTQAIFFHNSTLGLEKGDIAILQNYSLEGDPHPFVQSPRQSRPDATYEMQVTDPVLRLLVGADVGDGRVYGYDDCPIAPGRYQVWAYQTRSEALVAIFVSVGPETRRLG